METSTLIDCSGALVCAKDSQRFLLLQKNTGKHAGRWGLVGGTNQHGETAWQGLLREIEEELGLKQIAFLFFTILTLLTSCTAISEKALKDALKLIGSKV